MYDFVVFKNHEILKTRSIKKKLFHWQSCYTKNVCFVQNSRKINIRTQLKLLIVIFYPQKTVCRHFNKNNCFALHFLWHDPENETTKCKFRFNLRQVVLNLIVNYFYFFKSVMFSSTVKLSELKFVDID